MLSRELDLVARIAAVHRGVSRALLARLDALSRTQHVNPAMFALLYAALGERLEALASAKRALAQHDTWNSGSLYHRGMTRFKDDAEFIELARRGDRLLDQDSDR